MTYFQTSIQGQPIHELMHAAGVETALIYDFQTVVRNAEAFADFDVVRFSLRECGSAEFWAGLRREGGVVEVANARQLALALEAGFLPKPSSEEEVAEIVFAADLFEGDALRLCVGNGLRVACGSIDMIHQLGRALVERPDTEFPVEMAIAVNIGDDSDPRGIWYEQVDMAVSAAGKYGMAATGLELHAPCVPGLGQSGLVRRCEAMRYLARRVGSALHTFACEMDPELEPASQFAAWNDVREEMEREFLHGITLEARLGACALRGARYLVTTVRAVKNAGENTFYMIATEAAPGGVRTSRDPAICPEDGVEPEAFEVLDVQIAGVAGRFALPRAFNGDFLVFPDPECVGEIRPLVVAPRLECGNS